MLFHDPTVLAMGLLARKDSKAEIKRPTIEELWSIAG
jgi:hypothetical protein